MSIHLIIFILIELYILDHAVKSKPIGGYFGDINVSRTLYVFGMIISAIIYGGIYWW